MPEIQNPEITRKIERAYGLVGYPGPGIISPEIVPVTIVDNLIVEDDVPFFGSVVPATGAATYSIAALYNPSGSNVICTVERVVISRAVNGDTLMSLVNGVSWANTVTTRGVADGRRGTTRTPNALLKNEAKGALFTAHYRFAHGGYTSLDLVGPWILDEDDGLQIGNATQNQDFKVSFYWRERAKDRQDDALP